MSFKETEVSADVLIIGGGGASLRAAIEAKEMGADVLVVSKSRIGYGNNTYISAGIFAATGWGDPADDDAVHLKDAVIGGRFLNDQGVLAAAAKEAGAQVSFLEKCGVRFFKRDDTILLGQAPGHSYPRHVNVTQRNGSGFMVPLISHAEKIGVRFLNQVFITRLLTRDNRIAGATGLSPDGAFLAVLAKSVILTTGGFGRLYQHTNNAAGITGDGQALAFELGLALRDMEFVQFYPTAIGQSGIRMLLYEAFVARFGAVLRNIQGENIVEKHGLSDLKIMTRDRMSRAIMQEILEGNDKDGSVILDLNPVADIARLAPMLPGGWTESQKEILVSPTTHFCMGGIVINERTETEIPGLFAAGEVCGGVHGANRLGGNALAEVFALGGVAGRQAAKKAAESGPIDPPSAALADERSRLASLSTGNGKDQHELRRSLREVMWLKAGIIRNYQDLTDARTQIEALQHRSLDTRAENPKQLMKLLELQNMLLLADIVCQGALLRTESRGAHYRTDYPEEDNAHWLKNIFASKKEGKIQMEVQPVSFDRVSLTSGTGTDY